MVVYCREGEDRIGAAENVELRSVRIRSAAHRAFLETVALSRVRADVFVSPNESVPRWLSAPTVVVAQNLAYHCPRAAEGFRGGTRSERLVAGAQTAYYRWRMPAAYRRSSAVVAISETAARLLAQKAGLESSKAVIALGGSDSIFLEPRPRGVHSPDRLLVVSALAPYKNFNALIDALALLRRNRPELRLAIAGPDWRGYQGVVADRARARRVADSVQFLGPLPPGEIAQLYASSTLLLHLSECEACPLPPLEAMRAGLPVVAARRSSIPEVVGDGARLVDPGNPVAVATAVERILADADEMNALRERGRARAAELTWERTAAGVAEAVKRALRAVR